MDAIEILGGLLGRKAGGSGAGADILKDILMGGKRPGSQPRPAPQSRDSEPMDLEAQAKELEDLLNVANERKPGRSPSPQQPAPQYQQPRAQQPSQYEQPTQYQQPPQRQQPPQYQQPSRPGSSFPQSNPFPEQTDQNDDPFQQNSTDQNEQALVLVRAMVNASKCDGKISQEEQQSILQHVGDSSEETIQFLRNEFAQPLDVREFAWNVPIGMEQKVYTMSLIAMKLDTNPEANYLRELAHGLRLSPQVCNQIHQRHGAPNIF